ncbi:unnamed protein product [Trifolium pratense]|uniref:Uncharacterized protein n=1 Tax=Trifolium pratense TaxID=57577 RepID=A0ACB0JHT7_TRIPR|nr:unnamed protein product [Trifolium pratense]
MATKWKLSGRNCSYPKNSKRGLAIRAASLDRFGQKPQASFMNSTYTTNGFVDLKDRSDAYLLTYGFNFLGAEANINIWNPKVEKPEDFTTAQIWLKSDSADNFETVEAGWMKDTYKSTGCFDLTCSGFVQTNKAVGLGGALGPISSYRQQYELNYGIYSDNDGNWWLKIKHNIAVGYWPKEFLGQSATMVQWGGQVFSYSVKTKPPHTGTQMGSGEEAHALFGGACYMSTSIEGEMKGSRYQGGMGKYKVAMLLLWVLFDLCTLLLLKVEARSSSYSLEREIETKLKLLNKPAVKSIQMMPNFHLESQSSSTKDVFNASSDVFQIWQKSGSCPEETIPIRRIRKEDLMRVASLDRFGQKPPEIFLNSTNITNHILHNLNNTDDIVDLKDRSDAHLIAYGFNFIGAEANINVWNPKVDKPEDFTTAQMWLKAANGGNFESIETGWTVNPKLYGDHNTRLFIYWTRDAYMSTGCFDLTCHGFVQTNKNIVLGGTIGPISIPSGQQYELNYGIFRDDDGKWWLKVKNSIAVGYWPAELIPNLGTAKFVQWGGQVFSHAVKTKPPHTGTQMGSGDEANNRFGHACYVSNVRIKDNSQILKYPQFVSTYTREPYCYGALNDAPYGKDPIFYFGGPGRNPPYCP